MVDSNSYVARYRLAPQFPFPCGLYDCLSAYLYLLTLQDPTTIILAGDSAGGGMVLR
jgi:acetyl esterase/lipase